MGYIIGGKQRKLLVEGTDSNFKNAVDANYTEVPNVMPQRSFGSLNAKQNSMAKRASGFQDVTRNAPLFNDPRYTSSTLAIPTDSRTLNGLYRFFSETDPIVGSALSLHRELPLADLRLGTCEDSGVQQHYEEMWDRINGIKLVGDITSEYYEIGECLPYGAWNEADYMWEQFAILNPDYVKIESTWVNQQPLIKLIPDEALKRIVSTQSPKFIYDQLPPEIIRYVLFNQEIPLEATNVFHIAHGKRPYETHGRSLIKRILKILMLEDRFNQANFALATRHAVPITVVKVGDPASGWVPANEEIDAVRDMFCYDEKTEVLTDNGFKFYNDITTSDKIACFNEETKSMEYHYPTDKYCNQYDGDMIHFNSRGTDVMVTPNHRTLIKRKNEWMIVNAEQVEARDKFRACVDGFISENIPDIIDIIGKKVYTKDWFEFVGWYVSEGSVLNGRKNCVNISQSLKSKHKSTIESLMKRLPWKTGCYKQVSTVWGKDFSLYVENELGKGSENKKIPRWMINTNRKYLEILFESYLNGDGYRRFCKNGVLKFSATTASKNLADNLQEIALKLGYHIRISVKKNIYLRDKKGVKQYIRQSGNLKGKPYFDKYMLEGSNGELSKFPSFTHNLSPVKRECYPLPEIPKRRGNKHLEWDKIDLEKVLKSAGSAQASGKVIGCSEVQVLNQMKKLNIESGNPGQRYGEFDWKKSESIKRISYKGKIWCFTVPTGLFITRRNGQLTIQGNSAFEIDPNFTIFYHFGISVEFYGSNGRMLPIGPELDRIYRLKFIGLNVHEQMLAGAGGSYSQAYVNLEVQRQRYLNLQLKLETFMHNGVFKPVADMCGFYKLKSAIAGYGGVSKERYGKEISVRDSILSSFTTLRDDRDNQQFHDFVTRKAEEASKSKQIREYVFPKLDWGQMSAATDENLKNYIKWLSEKRPWLVDDAMLARMARLDRDTQEKAYMADLKRKELRYQTIAKAGLLPFIEQKKGQEPIDLGGIGEISQTPGGGGDMGEGLVGGGGEGIPNAPIGAGGPPETANATVPPAGGGAVSRLRFVNDFVERYGGEVEKDALGDDLFISNENRDLMKKLGKKEEKALTKIIG